jgi:two-component system response regulator FixJ
MTKPIGPRAWIVDDSRSVRESTRALLESSGIDTLDYGSAREFLDHFDPAATGCLVADFHMPGMTGLELLREIRARGSALPVIIITGRGDGQLREQAMDAGALTFLNKPVDEDELLGFVEPHVSGAF